MKAIWGVIGAFAVLVVVAAFFLYKKSTELIEMDIYDPNAPAVGERLDQRDMANLVARVVENTVLYTEGQIETPVTAQVILTNTTKKVITSVTFEITVTSDGSEPFVTKSLIKNFPALNRFHGEEVLLPYMSSLLPVIFNMPVSHYTYGRTVTAKILEATYVDPSTDLKNPDYMLAFLLMNDLPEVRKRFEADPSLLKVVSFDKLTPVLMACSQGDPAMVDYFIEKGQDVKAEGARGINGLHLAASNGSPEMVAHLAKLGVDVNAKDSQDRTPLYWAAQLNKDYMIKPLIEAGADPEIYDDQGMNPLYVCSHMGNLETVIELVNNGSDINFRSPSGSQCIHIATLQGRLNVVQYMLDKGVDINTRETQFGWTPLHYAAAYGMPHTVLHLLEKGADPKIKTKDGRTLFDLVDSQGHPTNIHYMEEALRGVGITR